MSKNKQRFITGIYLAICVSISGYLYLNPTTYDREGSVIKHFRNGEFVRFDYINFKYSVLISVVIGILIYSILQLFKKKTE